MERERGRLYEQKRARQNFGRMEQKGKIPGGKVKSRGSDIASFKTTGKRSLYEKMRGRPEILITMTAWIIFSDYVPALSYWLISFCTVSSLSFSLILK